jgi:hypothetical protein
MESLINKISDLYIFPFAHNPSVKFFLLTPILKPSEKIPKKIPSDYFDLLNMYILSQKITISASNLGEIREMYIFWTNLVLRLKFCTRVRDLTADGKLVK